MDDMDFEHEVFHSNSEENLVLDSSTFTQRDEQEPDALEEAELNQEQDAHEAPDSPKTELYPVSPVDDTALALNASPENDTKQLEDEASSKVDHNTNDNTQKGDDKVEELQSNTEDRDDLEFPTEEDSNSPICEPAYSDEIDAFDRTGCLKQTTEANTDLTGAVVDVSHDVETEYASEPLTHNLPEPATVPTEVIPEVVTVMDVHFEQVVNAQFEFMEPVSSEHETTANVEHDDLEHEPEVEPEPEVPQSPQEQEQIPTHEGSRTQAISPASPERACPAGEPKNMSTENLNQEMGQVVEQHERMSPSEMKENTTPEPDCCAEAKPALSQNDAALEPEEREPIESPEHETKIHHSTDAENLPETAPVETEQDHEADGAEDKNQAADLEPTLSKVAAQPRSVSHVKPVKSGIRPPQVTSSTVNKNKPTPSKIKTPSASAPVTARAAHTPAKVASTTVTPRATTKAEKPPPSSASMSSSVGRPPRPASSIGRQRTESQSSRLGSAKAVTPSLPTTPRLSKKYAGVQSRISAKSDHTPQGGQVKIFHENRQYNVQSKVGSMDNARHIPGGGNVKIESVKLNFNEIARPRIDAKAEPPKPRVEKKIPTQKLQWTAQSKVGSLDNAKHRPTGGNIKIESRKLEWKAESKIGSKENVGHVAGGGKVKIESRKLEWNTDSKIGSKDNIGHVPGGGNVRIFHEPVDLSSASPRIGSLENARHAPGGGNIKIFHEPVDLSTASPRIGSLENARHTPGGGNIKIFHDSVDLSHASPRVGSLENAHHTPGGGNVKIEDRKLDFKQTARSKINSVSSNGGSVLSRGSSERSMPGAVDPLSAQQVLQGMML